LEDGDSGEIIARLAGHIAYEAAMTWGAQMEGWARSDKDPDRKIPKSTVDMITFKDEDEDPANGNN
jgi:hypothetical protein